MGPGRMRGRAGLRGRSLGQRPLGDPMKPSVPDTRPCRIPPLPTSAPPSPVPMAVCTPGNGVAVRTWLRLGIPRHSISLEPSPPPAPSCLPCPCLGKTCSEVLCSLHQGPQPRTPQVVCVEGRRAHRGSGHPCCLCSAWGKCLTGDRLCRMGAEGGGSPTSGKRRLFLVIRLLEASLFVCSS